MILRVIALGLSVRMLLECSVSIAAGLRALRYLKLRLPSGGSSSS
jgi:hypothetical protein